MTDCDHSYKRLFSHQIMIADLIRGFLGTDLAEICDLNSLERCNGSYVTDELKDQEDDLIWKLRWGERTLVLYLLLEFQSKPDPSMPVRIMSYMALLWQDLIRTGAINPVEPLPGIIPIVLYNGKTQWNTAHDIRDIISIPSPVLHLRPSVPYLLLDELRLSVHQLIEVRNLAACLFGLEQSAKSADMIRLGEELNVWMSCDPTMDALRNDFLLFFDHGLKRNPVIEIPNPFRGGTMLYEKVDEWIAEYRAEGKIEGKVEGKVEGIILAIRQRIVRGKLTREEAKQEICDLEMAGILNSDDVSRVLAQLG